MSISQKTANKIIVTLSAGCVVLALFGLFQSNQTLVSFETNGEIVRLDGTSEGRRPLPSAAGEVLEPPVGTTTETSIVPIEEGWFQYVEVIDGCGPYFDGDCLAVRSGPGTDFGVTHSLRNGMVMKVSGQVEREGRVWYKIVFDEWLRYPERLRGDWYVAADFVRVLYDEGDKTIDISKQMSISKKHIVVDRSEQKLYAYDGEELFMKTTISTGLELTPTPRGVFTVFKKTPSRYMQGPLPWLVDQQVYDLPGVPWNLYFTEQGAVIHGAYWHDKFGKPYSHGCVNLSPAEAEKLYEWADLGTEVVVQD